MFGGDWRKQLAIGLGALVAVGLILFSAHQYSEAQSQHEAIGLASDDSAKKERDQARAKIQGCTEAIAALDEQEACKNEAAEESQKRIREIHDLEAQQTMALWTRHMGVAAIIGITVGIIGMGLIFSTFWETRKTARAGLDANKIARESAEQQVRAYLSIKHTGFRFSKGQSKKHAYNFVLGNRGSSPAYRVQTSVWCMVERDDFMPALPTHQYLDTLPKSMVGPGGEFGYFDYPFKTNGREKTDVKEGRKAVFLVVSLLYYDVFGKQRRCDWIHKSDWLNRPNSLAAIYTSEHEVLRA